jgi:lactate dehydrogenase-like 2-hydroxyacid dehydrogenase
MKPEILLVVPIYAPTMAALERDYTVHKLWTAADAGVYLREKCANVRGVVTAGLHGCEPGIVAALPKLEIIASFGSPRRSMDFEGAAARGIVITNTPDSIVENTADIALGLVIAVMRRLCEGDRYVRAGKWPQAPFPPGRNLAGKTCGIVGLGRVGRAIAKRVEVLGMKVAYHGPNRKPDVAWPYHADLLELARAADCLVVSCGLTDATRGIIDSRVFGALKPDAFLVNIGRGPLVDQQALIAALAGKKIAGAGLDVFWNEPEVPAELARMENVVVTPHIGSTTLEIRDERGRKVLANLAAKFAGQPVPNPVTKPHMLD